MGTTALGCQDFYVPWVRFYHPLKNMFQTVRVAGMAGSRTDAVKLVGPVGLKDMVETALRYNGGGFVYLPFPVEYQELPPGMVIVFVPLCR